MGEFYENNTWNLWKTITNFTLKCKEILEIFSNMTNIRKCILLLWALGFFSLTFILLCNYGPILIALKPKIIIKKLDFKKVNQIIEKDGNFKTQM